MLVGMALLWATEAESRVNTQDCLCTGRTVCWWGCRCYGRQRLSHVLTLWTVCVQAGQCAYVLVGMALLWATEAESCANILESLCAGGTMHLRAGGDVVAMGDRG